jgi:hypothetical protein
MVQAVGAMEQGVATERVEVLGEVLVGVASTMATGMVLVVVV